jgi:hypothetical protein
MKYSIQLNSQPQETVAEKHLRLLSVFEEFKDFFQLNGLDVSTPDFGTHIFATRSFNKYLPKYLKLSVHYRYRAGLEDTSLHDDYLQFEFVPDSIDFAYLVNRVFPALIVGFDAYFGYIANYDLVYEDFKKSRDKDSRNEIIRFYPILFISNELCQRHLNLSASKVYERAKNHIKQAVILHEGILLVSSTMPLSIEESNTIDNFLKALLKP